MSFTDPNNMTSPQKRWKLHNVLYDSKEDGWSVTEGMWDDEKVLAIRWNGGKENEIGHPQSRGLPVWFILPSEIEGVLRKEITRLNKSQKKSI